MAKVPKKPSEDSAGLHPPLAPSEAAIPARATPPRPASLEDGVTYIAERMARFDWPKGETKRLAKAWGMPVGTLYHWTSEASRRVMSPKNAEALLPSLTQRIAELAEEAVNRTEEALDKEGNPVKIRKPDLHTALRALAEVGALLGMRVERVEQTVSVKDLTDQQLAEQLALLVDNPSVKAALEAKKLVEAQGEAVESTEGPGR